VGGTKSQGGRGRLSSSSSAGDFALDLEGSAPQGGGAWERSAGWEGGSRLGLFYFIFLRARETEGVFMYCRLSWNSQSSCLRLLSAGITGMNHHDIPAFSWRARSNFKLTGSAWWEDSGVRGSGRVWWRLDSLRPVSLGMALGF
jgi:hypothetical protein